MIQENIDEDVVYRTACDNVKKIAKAIRAIKIKYYPNFKISEEDQKIYDGLQQEIENISKKHGLKNLKEALMEEISARYDNRSGGIRQEQGNQNSVDNILLACYGAIEAEQKALSGGKIKQALKCQEILQQYQKEISLMPDSQQLLERIIEYKREKYGELTLTKEEKEQRNGMWENRLKGYYNMYNAQKRDEATQNIIEEPKENLTEAEQDKEQIVV